MTIIRTLFALLVGLAFDSSSQELDIKMAAYLDSMVAAQNIPGISVGVLVDEEIIWTGAAGYQNIDKEMKATPETLFRIGSISKVLTATAAMRLVEQGLLDLEASVQDYITDYPASKKGTIKVKHLIHHTSGIAHYKGNENRTFTSYQSLRDACKVFENRKLKFSPGTKYSYTSYGYTLLGAIMEEAYGKSFDEIMDELIFEPANMKNTFLEERASLENLAELYRKEGAEIVKDVENDLSIIYPAGGMVSTSSDLLSFMLAWNKGSLVTDDTKKMMLAAPTYQDKILDEYGGIGWNFWEHKKHGLVYHRIGGQSGTSSLLLSYADTGVTVILLSNQAVLDPIWEIANTYIGYGLNYEKE